MTIHQAAWIHPNPLLASYVVLPDGFQMSREEAEGKGFTVMPWPETERVAAPHPHERESVVLSRGQVVSIDTAKSAGFTLSERAQNGVTNPHRSWRSAIMRLPEAQNRVSATAEILTSQSLETMSVDSARAFLRGLPTEQAEEQTTVTTNTDPRAARLAEINNSMAAFNRNNGYQAKPKANANAAPSLASVEPTKLRRLAEIRLNALQSGATPTHANEHNHLKYALEVRDIPLANTFAMLHVDTSKILPPA